MPKYYCDYCDTFLTHDSPSVRKTHNGGRKHKENVRQFYQVWMEQQAQKLVDATTLAFTQQRMLNQGGMPSAPSMMPRGVIPPPMMHPSMANMPMPFMPQMPAMPPMMAPRPGMPPPGAMIPPMMIATPRGAPPPVNNGPLPQQASS